MNYFFLHAIDAETGISEEALLVDDRKFAIQLEVLLGEIYGRQQVTRHMVNINELPQNILEALEAKKNREPVDDRFSTTKWCNQKIAEEEKERRQLATNRSEQ